MEKKFYNSDGKMLSYNLGSRINSGGYGQIFKVSDNECLKMFFEPRYEGDKYNIEDIDAFKLIMELDIENIYKVYQILYGYRHTVDGYVMKYYEPVKMDLFDTYMDYFLDNLNSLYKTMIELSKNKISMLDFHEHNTILTNDGIVIVDADMFRFSNNPFLRELNKRKLYLMFTNLFLFNLGGYYGNLDNILLNKYATIIYQLFNIDNSPDIIYRKVRSYNKPMDYLHSQLNK